MDITFYCQGCQKKNTHGLITTRLVKSKCTKEEIEKKHYPTLNVMLKQSCKHCGKFRKFLSQNENIMELANNDQETLFENHFNFLNQ